MWHESTPMVSYAGSLQDIQHPLSVGVALKFDLLRASRHVPSLSVGGLQKTRSQQSQTMSNRAASMPFRVFALVGVVFSHSIDFLSRSVAHVSSSCVWRWKKHVQLEQRIVGAAETEKTCPHIRMLHHHVEDHVDQTERSGATAQHRRVPSTCSGALRGYRRNKPFVNQARLTCTRDVGNGQQLRNQLQEQCKSWQDWELRTPWCFVHPPRATGQWRAGRSDSVVRRRGVSTVRVTSLFVFDEYKACSRTGSVWYLRDWRDERSMLVKVLEV